MNILPERMPEENKVLSPLSLISGLLLALILIVLWCIPAVHSIFLHYDRSIFIFLNQSLSRHHGLAVWWSLLNSRYTDFAVGIIMAGFLLLSRQQSRQKDILRTFCTFLLLLLLLLVIRTLLTWLIEAWGWQHASPSRLVPGVYYVDQTFSPHLSALLRIKSGSVASFPGDHASVLLLWAFYMTHLLNKTKAILLVWIIALFFMLPRLVAGAHWASDIYTGGLAVAVAAYVLGIKTSFTDIYSLKLAAFIRRQQQRLCPCRRI